MRQQALSDFRDAVKQDDAGRTRDALEKLVLFSENDSVAGTIGSGLDAGGEIQVEGSLYPGEGVTEPADRHGGQAGLQ